MAHILLKPRFVTSLLCTLTLLSMTAYSATDNTSIGYSADVFSGPVATPIVTDTPVAVYFLNGIYNTDIQAQISAIALFKRLKQSPLFAQLVDNKQVSLRTLYNPNDPFLGDILELDAQAKIQKSALAMTEQRMQSEQLNSQLDAYDLEKMRAAIFNEEMYQANQRYYAQAFSRLNFMHKAGNRAIEHYDMLGAEVKRALLTGEKVVIVAHSQGNYVAQGIYANLAQDMAVNAHLSDNLQIVGVANVAGSTPSNSYISHDKDKAVYTLHQTFQGGRPLAANFKAHFDNGESLGGAWESTVQRQNDTQNHGFIETYLSARFDEDTKFTPHYPEIVQDTGLPMASQASPTIYSVIVDKMNAGLERLLSS